MYEKYSKVLLLIVQIILIGAIDIYNLSPLMVPVILISICLMITSTKEE